MRYILFDLYGLFHHVQTPQQFAEIAERIGTDADSLRPFYLGKFRHSYDAGLIDAAQYWQLIESGLGIEIDWRAALEADNDSWEGVDADMVDFARQLHAAGVPIALLSNEPPELTALTRARREWITLFDPVVFSSEVGLAKPDPAIFELALNRMREADRGSVGVGGSVNAGTGVGADADAVAGVGADADAVAGVGVGAVADVGLRPGDVLFVDDSLVNIEAARKLGFATHLFEGIQGLRDVVAEALGERDGLTSASADGAVRQ